MDFWTELRAHGPASDGLFFGILIELVHGSSFLLFTGIYLALDRMAVFDKFRIRPRVVQDAKLTRSTIKEILLSHTLTVPYIWLLVWPVMSWRGVSIIGPAPPLATAALQIIGSMLTEDFLFYWLHRAMHHRLIYKYVHKQHHSYKNTVSYAAEYSSAIEQSVANVIPTYSGPVLFRMHISTLLFWLFLRMWETADAHSGYVLPWSPWNACLAIQGGTARHDFHHSHNVGSFGSFFKFWDWAMGTDADFRSHQRKAVAMPDPAIRAEGPSASVTEAAGDGRKDD
eukprot:m.25893 g.25893  ORF g.25893 m.25893 type:complete len:284 (+) comp4219_c0_seq1:47-898(+)